MYNYQSILITIFALYSLSGVLMGSQQIKKYLSFYPTYIYYLLGAFVWGDVFIFGIFWTLISILVFIFDDWTLFWVFVSVFWFIRSLGETIYWLLQQFASKSREPVEKVAFYSFFKNESVWFVQQIIWQCITVVTLISSVWLVNLWLK